MAPSVLLATTLAVGALVYLALAAYVWRFRRAGGGRALSLLLLAAGAWAGCYSQEFSADTLADAQVWSDLKYPGYVALAPALWAFVLGYTGALAARVRLLVGALLVEPVVVLVLLAVPATHHLIHTYPDEVVRRHYLGGAPLPHPGVLYLPHIVYTFAAISSAVAVLVARLSRIRGPFRRPSRLMIGSAVLPLVASMLSNIGLIPAEWPDPAAFLFGVTGVVLVWGFFRLRLVDLLPGAWRTVVARMPDAVMVVDDAGRLLDTNPAADRLLGPTVGVGCDVLDAVPHLAPVLAVDVREGTAVRDVVVPALAVAGTRSAALAALPGEASAPSGVATAAGVLEAQVTAIGRPGMTATARIVVLRDVTERRVTEAQLREVLRERTDVARILAQCLQPDDLPRVPGLELATRSFAADGGDALGRLGGDFCDVHRTGDGAWALCLGEVAGRDVRAAALTALARSALRMLSAQGLPPGDVLAGLNRILVSGVSVSALAGDVEGVDIATQPHGPGGREPPEGTGGPRTCATVYARFEPTPPGAGRDLALQVALGTGIVPLLRRPDGTVVAVAGTGMVLGTIPAVTISVSPVTLSPGSVLLACTGGVLGSRFHSERFGPERLALALQRAPATAAGAADAVLDAVRRFATQTDDLAVLAVAPAVAG